MTSRILVVDDEPLIAMMLQDWLVELGLDTVGPAGSVSEALSLIRDARVDGAILDVSLGSEKSYPAVEALLSRSIPVALATGHGRETLDERFRNLPLLAKPYDFDAVRRVVMEFGKLSV